MPEDKDNMDVQTAFNMLVQLARQAKLSYSEHERVTLAIETVLNELNGEGKSHHEVREISSSKKSKGVK